MLPNADPSEMDLLCDSDKPLVPGPPRSVPRQKTKNTGDLRALTPRATKTAWSQK